MWRVQQVWFAVALLDWCLNRSGLGDVEATVDVRVVHVERAWRTADPSSRVGLACTQLAIDAVNTRAGHISSSLSTLKHNFTISLASTASFGPEWHTWTDQLKELVESTSAHAMILSTSSTYAVQVADYANLRGVPAMLVGQTSPIFNQNPDQLWPYYFRLYPSSASVIPEVCRFVRAAGWTHVAVLYAPTDRWSSSMAHELRASLSNYTIGAGGQAIQSNLHALSFDTDDDADRIVFASIQQSGVRILLSLMWMRERALEKSLETYGMIGSSPAARGYAFLVIDEEGACESEGAIVFGRSCTMSARLAVGHAAARNLQDDWRKRMPKLDIALPGGGRITALDRLELDADVLYTACYDAIVALAVAVDGLLERVPGHPSILTTKNLRHLLTEQLGLGVTFAPLGEYGSRGGHPWTDPEALSSIANVVKGERRSIAAPTDAIFPGDSADTPDAFLPTPCTESTCGVGVCVLEAAIGRDPGWCQCPHGRVGRDCTMKGSMDTAPKSHLGFQLSLTSVEFRGFSDSGDRFTVRLQVKLQFADVRLGLQSRTYDMYDVGTLQRERQFWLPALRLPPTAAVTATHTVDIDDRNVTMEADIIAEFHANEVWHLFPFDHHTVSFEVGLDSGLWLRDPMPSADSVDASCAGKWIFVGGREAGFSLVHYESTLVGSFVVQRNIMYFMLRTVIPSIVLVVVSWAGFFIKPAVLMPRFASAFISYLALQTFMQTARDEMPAQLTVVCITDVYMSSIGLLMGLAIVENVTAQFLFEHVSISVSKDVDAKSRYLFPLAYILLLISIFLLRDDINNAFLTSHLIIVGLCVGLVMWIIFIVKYFPSLVLRRALYLRSKHGSSAHPALARMPFMTPTERELSYIFAAIDEDASGALSEQEIEKWVISTVRPRLNAKEQDALKLGIKAYFTDRLQGEDVRPEEFSAAFNDVIRAIANARRGIEVSSESLAKISCRRRNSLHQFLAKAYEGHANSSTSSLGGSVPRKDRDSNSEKSEGDTDSNRAEDADEKSHDDFDIGASGQDAHSNRVEDADKKKHGDVDVDTHGALPCQAPGELQLVPNGLSATPSTFMTGVYLKRIRRV